MKTHFIIGVAFSILFFACDLEKVDSNVSNPKPTFETFQVLDASITLSPATVLELNEDGYVVSGTYNNKFGGSNGIFIAKFNLLGQLQKIVKDHGTSNPLIGGEMIKSANNEFVLVGSEDLGNLTRDIAVIKYDENLVQIGQIQTYGNPTLDENGNAIELMEDGNLLIAGKKHNGSVFGPYFLKINYTTGAVMDELFDTNDPFATNSIYSIVRNGQHYGAIGNNLGISIPFSFFMKIDKNLNILVNGTNINGADLGAEVVTNGADGFVVGNSLTSQFIRQGYISSINSSGTESTPVELFTSFSDSGISGVSRDSKNQYAACGWAGNINNAAYNASAVLLNSNFDIIQSYIYQLNTGTQFTAVSATTDNGYILAGYSGDKLLLIKLNSNFKI